MAVGVGTAVALGTAVAIIVASALSVEPGTPAKIATAADAARALEPAIGRFAEMAFAVGILAVGLLAVPVLIQGVALVAAELRGIELAAGASARDLPGFRRVLAGSLLVAVGFEASGVAPMHALVAAAVANGVAAPGVLAVLTVAGRSRSLLGAERVGPAATGVLALGTLLAAAAPVLWLATALLG